MLEEAFQQRVPAVVTCPVDYGENLRLTEGVSLSRSVGKEVKRKNNFHYEGHEEPSAAEPQPK
jgi:hypothetical protein